MKKFIVDIFQKVKHNFYEIYNASGSSHEIALGAAIGAFWGVFPTFGVSTVLTLMLSKFLRFNLLAAISAAFISNPLTSPFWLMASYKVGTLFVKSNIEFDMEHWTENLSEVGAVMLLGSTLVSSFTGLTVYYVTKFSIEYRRKLKDTR